MSDLGDQLNVALAGRYRIERELGRGGMATVFLAEDARHRRKVAIKVLHPELAAVLGTERFLREIEIAAGLSHPHILPLHDSGAADGLLYYVMPYVEGESLRQRLGREKQLPVEDALRIARETADALHYAHRRGVVHRDIKPENILMSDQHAVVADFGIARAVLAAGGETLTATGALIGTPAYMSPEQTMGSAELDGRSDQYSLACVLYEMLAGAPVFAGPTLESLAHQHLSVAPRAITELRPAVPTKVSTAIRRALAKTAADRFTSAAEFASALTAATAEGMTTLEDTPVTSAIDTRDETQEWSRKWSRKRATRAAVVRRRLVASMVSIAGIVLALAVWKFAPSIFRRGATAPGKKAWILVAEFEGPPADSLVVRATRDLVTAALDQSEIVTTVPRDQIRLALQSAGKPASTPVSAELARELAYRSAVRTVVEGQVGRLGSGYSVVLKVVDAEDARVLVSVSDAARNEDSLIPTVGRIAKKLRAELGEQQSALQATRELALTVTPSFEAFKAWATGRDLLFAGENRAALAWFRKAIDLDPDYASAWLGVGYAFGNLGEPDSSLAALREADTRSNRLPERGRLFCTLAISYLTEDISSTLALSERQVQLDPENPAVYANRSAYLTAAGRYDEALEWARKAERISPFGASQIALLNQFWNLLWGLGRIEEARRLVPRLQGRNALEAPMDIAAAGGQWSTAESLATALRSNPYADADLRRTAATFEAAVQASRGQVTVADQTLHQLQSDAEATRELTQANRIRWDRLRLALFSRGVAAVPGSPGSWDSTTAGLVVHGAWAAAAGDSALAQRLLFTIRRRPGPDVALQGFLGPALVEGWLAARDGRWEDVLRHLGPAAPHGEAAVNRVLGGPGGAGSRQSAPLVRWLVAEAYDHLDRPDSAAVYFELAIAPPPTGGANITHTRTAFSFGQRRLALLYARMGRLEEAKRHWEIFSGTFTHPDPEMQPLVDEAHAALVSAEGIAKSAR